MPYRATFTQNEHDSCTGCPIDFGREGKRDFDITVLSKVKKLQNKSKKFFILLCSEYP